MGQFNNIVIRCELYPNEVGELFKTVALGEIPKMWQNAQVEFQFGLFQSRSPKTLYDISNLSGLPELRIRETNADGTLLLDGTASGAVVKKDPNLDLTSWEDGTRQHLRFYFPQTATGITTGRQYIVISGADGDIFGTSEILVSKPGTQVSAAPAAGDPEFYTKDQVRALLDDFSRKLGRPGETRALTSRDGKWRAIEELVWDADQGARIVVNYEEVQNPQV